MRIGVISDTHMPYKAKQLPAALVEGLHGVDLILHAGDWTSPEVAAALTQIAPLEGVMGNNDGADIAARFRHRMLLQLEGWRIGIVHGHIGGRSTLDNAIETFRQDAPDVIVFGHSHIPHLNRQGSCLLFNPGSPTDKRFQPKYSYGILELGPDGVNAVHHYYDSKQ